VDRIVQIGIKFDVRMKDWFVNAEGHKCVIGTVRLMTVTGWAQRLLLGPTTLPGRERPQDLVNLYAAHAPPWALGAAWGGVRLPMTGPSVAALGIGFRVEMTAVV
jgi:hypothetical protein